MQQGDFILSGKVDIDESGISGKGYHKQGHSKDRKREFAIGIQMLKTKIVGAFTREIQNANTREVETFFDRHISAKAHVPVDKWRACNLIKKYYPDMIQHKSKPIQNFKLLHRKIIMLKAAILGIYHHVFHLQEYLYKFFFRNNLNDKSTLFHALITNTMNQTQF